LEPPLSNSNMDKFINNCYSNIRNGLTVLIKDGYFNLRSSKQFIISGYLLIIIGASAIIFSMLYITEQPREQTPDIIIDLLLLELVLACWHSLITRQQNRRR
jgi:uncharacterized membrane protein